MSRRLRLDGYAKRDPGEPDRVLTIWGGKNYGPTLWIGTENAGMCSMWAALSDRQKLRRLARRILQKLDATSRRRRP